MSTRTLLALALSTASLCAQQATPSPSASPSPSPAPSPQAQATPAVSPVSSQELAGRLKDDDIRKALSIVKDKFLDQSQVKDAALERATLDGLMARLSPGVVLVDVSAESPDPGKTPFLAEILDGHIGYLRLGSLESDIVPQIDAALLGFKGKKIDAIVLDLRGAPPGSDFEVAADIARRFSPKGRLLFSVQKPSAKQERIYTSNQDPAFQGVVVVLTDARTEGAAEVVAATLRENAGAMIIGADTRGGAAEFADIPVDGSVAVRIAVARVMLSESKPLFPGGVKADLVVSLSPEAQAQIFRESREKGVSSFVFENERRRLNEAALVANMNPEIDSAQSIQRERNKTAPLRDTVLQRAIDLVTTINFYRAAPASSSR